MDEFVKAMEHDAQLRKEAFELLVTGGSTQDIVAFVKSRGFDFDEDQAEEALRRLQQSRAEKIGFEEIDPEQLERIAGGGSGVDCQAADDCDARFSSKPSFAKENRCYYHDTCDEFFCDEHVGKRGTSSPANIFGI